MYQFDAGLHLEPADAGAGVEVHPALGLWLEERDL